MCGHRLIGKIVVLTPHIGGYPIYTHNYTHTHTFYALLHNDTIFAGEFS